MRFLRMFVCAAVLTAPALAQTAQFEAASIKPSAPDNNQRSLSQKPGARLKTSGATVKMLIMLAYQVMPYQVTGGPDWLGSQGFDIDAVSADPKATQPQFREMLKSLLESRFQLRVHAATKELPVYVLARAPGAPKLVESKGDEQDEGLRITGAGKMTGVKATMSALATVLAKPLQRKVMDETGLAGAYDFTLQYASDLGLLPAKDSANDLPSIFTALREQLGLTLRESKGPVDVLVIDGAEKPSAN